MCPGTTTLHNSETGTDYCDLTGEIRWVRRMVELYDAKARETGARIINSCGFDSIPSDMGVYYLQEQAQQRFGQRRRQSIYFVYRAARSWCGFDR